MAEKTLNSRIQLRNDTAANWTTSNPQLLKGELGIEVDTRKFKIGDGQHNWNALEYANITDLSEYYTQGEVDGLIDELANDIADLENNKVDKVSGKGLSTNDYTTAEKNKLAGIEAGANMTVVDDYLSSTSTNPVQNKIVNSALGNKVDKVSGKGLSTNDYTTTEKTKLSGIASGATKVEDSTTNGNIKINGTETNVYTLPDDVVRDSDYVHTDTNFTSAEKTKLAGIQTGATKVESSTNNGKIKINGTETTVYTLPSDVVKDSSYVHTDNNYTTTEKNKLSGIAAGAQVNKLEGVQVNGTDLTITNKKANVAVPTKLSQLTNDSGFILNTVSNLTNYYAKSSTYTKTEVNNLINSISQFSAQIVSELPSSNISTTTIYLVSKSDTETDDYYDEYMYINNAWEMIGNTKIDLSNYYTKSQTYTRTEVNQLVEGVGNQLETTSTQVNTNKSNIEALQEDSHTHSNKAILDQMTAAFTAELKAWYDDVGELSHKHNNMAVLNKITQTYIDWWTSAYDAMHEHGNLSVLEGITAALITNWNTAYTNSHTHSNKSVLDNTTASYTTAEKTKLSGIATGANKTTTDTSLSTTSTNPVQNKVVTAELNNKLNDDDTLILDCGNASGV